MNVYIDDLKIDGVSLNLSAYWDINVRKFYP